MLCGRMIPVKNERFVPCGQCHACRVNRKRKVVGQLLLEALYSENHSSFITLTYNDQHYPPDGSLRPDHIQRFLNRLRKPSSLGPLRYFVVGEYGDKSNRAHYHLALFNCPPERAAPEVEKLWERNGESIGFTKTGYIAPESISYIAGYCTKKMGKNDGRLKGRYPEFNRRSKCPPLGASGIDAILDSLFTRAGSAALVKSGDVPHDFRINGRTYPISDYWLTHMRQEIGITEPPVSEPWAMDLSGYLQELEHAEKKSNANKASERIRSRRTI